MQKSRFNLVCLPPDLQKIVFRNFLGWKDLRLLSSAINVKEPTFNDVLMSKWDALRWGKQELDDSSWFLLWLQKRRVDYPHLLMKLVSNVPVLCSRPDVVLQDKLQNVNSLEWFQMPPLNSVNSQIPSLALFTSLTLVSLHGTFVDTRGVCILLSECASTLQVL